MAALFGEKVPVGLAVVLDPLGEADELPGLGRDILGILIGPESAWFWCRAIRSTVCRQPGIRGRPCIWRYQPVWIFL